MGAVRQNSCPVAIAIGVNSAWLRKGPTYKGRNKMKNEMARIEGQNVFRPVPTMNVVVVD